MKKLLIFVLLACVLVGCSSKEDIKLQATDVQINEQVISLDQNMSEVIEKIGTNYKLEESKSCMFDGNDKTYTYENFVINTYPNGNDDFVNSITLLNDTFKLSKDVHIGDSIDKIKSIMNETTTLEDEQSCSYEYETYGITFYLEKQVVSEIELYLIQK